MSTNNEEREPTREEVDLLHFYGFHEVKNCPGWWQRGRDVVDLPVEPEGPYPTEQALKLVRKQHGEQEQND